MITQAQLNAAIELFDKFEDTSNKLHTAKLIRRVVNQYLEERCPTPKKKRNEYISFAFDEIENMWGGKVIAAVKMVRKRTGLSLMDSKRAVNKYMEENNVKVR